MAEGDDLTNCPVCFDEYTETDERIPKILPCSHSLCEKCLEVLIRNNKMDCPECRVNHEAASGTKSFPQNKYIVTHLQKKQMIEAKAHKIISDGSCEMCPEHRREKIFFCKDAGCKKSVCPICFARHHRNHQSIDLEAQKKKCEPLLANIEALNRDLLETRRHLVCTKEDADNQILACTKAIKSQKEEMMKEMNKKFDSMLKEVTSMTRNDIDKKIAAIDESIILLDNMKEKVDPVDMTDDSINSSLETVQDMAVQNRDFDAGNPSLLTNIKYSPGVINSEMIDRICGCLETFGQSSQVPAAATAASIPKRELSASDFKLTGRFLAYVDYRFK